MLFFALMTMLLLETGELTVDRQVFEDPMLCYANMATKQLMHSMRQDIEYSYVDCVMEHHL